MSVLAAKVLLAPCFVVAASLVARRYGARIGGFAGALPVVAGPILLVYAAVHGSAFAAHAAAGTTLGLISLTSFVVVYSRLSAHASWPVCLIAGWGAFVLSTAILSALSVSPAGALALALAAFAGALLLLPRGHDDPRAPAPSPPRWDLPLRAVSALVLVFALTAVSGRLGAQLSGLLAPFPIIASVLAAFSHAQRGYAYAQQLLRGLVIGFVAFALFCFTLAVSLRPLGIAAAFAIATAVALLTQGSALSITLRTRPAPRSAPSAG